MLQIFIAGLLWGTVGVFVKELNSLGADASLTGFLRMFFAFAIMFVIALIRHGKNIIIRDKKTLLACLLIGVITNGVFNICYAYSVKLNGMAVASVLMYSAPVFTATASRIILAMST